MTVSLTIVSALAAIGLVIAWFVLREYADRVRKDLHTDAYEEGWSHGYDVGLQANRPKRTRKPKADA